MKKTKRGPFDETPCTCTFVHRCGGWKNFTFTRHKFLLVTVKEWLKSVLNYRSYPRNKIGYPFFLDHSVVRHSCYLLAHKTTIGAK